MNDSSSTSLSNRGTRVGARRGSRGTTVLLALAAVCFVSSASRASDDFEDDQVVVGLAPGASIAAVNARYSTYTIDHLAGTMEYQLGTESGEDLDILLPLMALDPDIIYAEKNQTSEAAEGIQGTIASVDRSATSSIFHAQPATTSLRASQAHVLSTGAGVVVAVVDNGVNPQHFELGTHLWRAGWDFVDGDNHPWETANGIDDDNDGLVDECFGHGTHVSGLVLLAAPGAIILPVRVLNDDGRGPAFRVAEGIRYAADNGANVINLSLSIRAPSSLVASAIEYARERGITVVAGAGNRNLPYLDFPASDQNVISAAATDAFGGKMGVSNYDLACTISAPGQDILSSYGSTDYARWSGTSMASGIVSGAAAVLLARYPDLEADEVSLKMTQTATSIASQNPSYPGMLGAGLVNLEGLASVAAPSAGSVKVHGGASSFVTWQPMEGATAYDVVRGSVSSLVRAGYVVSLGAVVCLANDLPSTTTVSSPDVVIPLPGTAAFYLVRPLNGLVNPDYQETARTFDRRPASGDCPR